MWYICTNFGFIEFVQEALDGAEDSIYIIMYRVNFDAHNKDSLVYRLMDSLVKAKGRGVEVKVILDYDWEAVQSPKRSFAYLVGILKSNTGKK